MITEAEIRARIGEIEKDIEKIITSANQQIGVRQALIGELKYVLGEVVETEAREEGAK